MSDEEELTPGVGKAPKVCKSEGISCTKKIGPAFWNRGGSGNSGILFQKDRPRLLECRRRAGHPQISKSRKVRYPKVSQSEGGRGVGGLLEHCSKSGDVTVRDLLKPWLRARGSGAWSFNDLFPWRQVSWLRSRMKKQGGRSSVPKVTWLRDFGMILDNSLNDSFKGFLFIAGLRSGKEV